VTGEGPRRAPGSPDVTHRQEPFVDAEVEAVEERLEPRPSAEAATPEAAQGPVTVGDLAEGTAAAIDAVATSAKRLLDQGRYRKLRISRKGKAVLPDIPLAAVAAVEAASLYGGGLARVLAVHVGARLLFDIEVVNEADKFFKAGVERFLEGDLTRAEEALLRAVKIDDTHAPSYFQLGVIYRMRGELDKARPVLKRATKLDPVGEIGKKAGDVLLAIDGESR
jgi:tetratricopeptide (TPR) repeat protein